MHISETVSGGSDLFFSCFKSIHSILSVTFWGINLKELYIYMIIITKWTVYTIYISPFILHNLLNISLYEREIFLFLGIFSRNLFLNYALYFQKSIHCTTFLVWTWKSSASIQNSFRDHCSLNFLSQWKPSNCERNPKICVNFVWTIILENFILNRNEHKRYRWWVVILTRKENIVLLLVS